MGFFCPDDMPKKLGLILISLLAIAFILTACGEDESNFTIKISPASKVLGVRKTQKFSASATDSQGNVLPKTFTWSVLGNVGTIDSSGNFYSGSTEGTGSVVASSSYVTASAKVDVTSKSFISGSIKNVNGEVIPNITVYITKVPTLQAVSGSTGEYFIQKVPFGTVEVSTKGTSSYLFATKEVFVPTGETVSCNITILNRFLVENESETSNPVTISGDIKNLGTTEALGVSITYSFFDEAGILSATGSQNVGSISSFESKVFSIIPTPSIDSYYRKTKSVSATSF